MIELGEVRGVDLPLREAGRLVVAGDHEAEACPEGVPDDGRPWRRRAPRGLRPLQGPPRHPAHGFHDYEIVRRRQDLERVVRPLRHAGLPRHRVPRTDEVPGRQPHVQSCQGLLPRVAPAPVGLAVGGPRRPGYGSRSAKGAPEGSTTSSSAPGTRATTGLP